MTRKTPISDKVKLKNLKKYLEKNNPYYKLKYKLSSKGSDLTVESSQSRYHTVEWFYPHEIEEDVNDKINGFIKKFKKFEILDRMLTPLYPNLTFAEFSGESFTDSALYFPLFEGSKLKIQLVFWFTKYYSSTPISELSVFSQIGVEMQSTGLSPGIEVHQIKLPFDANNFDITIEQLKPAIDACIESTKKELETLYLQSKG